MKKGGADVATSVLIGHDNLEEFRDPANYDLEESPQSGQRIEFYCELADAVGGPVLELGCGTGLVSIPIARRGLDVTGIDLARPMLDFAELKARREGVSVRWVQADARQAMLARQFQFIYMTGNAFQAFLSRQDQESLLRSIKSHLAKDGTFAFETRNPSGHELTTRRDEEHWFDYTNSENRSVRVSGTQCYDPILQIMHWKTFRRWTDERGVHVEKTRIACRFFFPQELAALLHYNGVEIVRQYGNWNKEPLVDGSPTIISLCTHRQDKRAPVTSAT